MPNLEMFRSPAFIRSVRQGIKDWRVGRVQPLSEVVAEMGLGCHAGKDGDCIWEECPQLRDNEPVKSGRHCPLDTEVDDEY